METTPQQPDHWFAKICLSCVGLLFAAVVGYLMVYWLTFGNFSDVLDVSTLRSQVVSNQKADTVKDQLRDLGYDFEEEEFFRLNDPGSTNRYRANVVGGYQAEPIDDEPLEEEGYYFYDEDGFAYYFTVGPDNEIDPDSLIPLNAE